MKNLKTVFLIAGFACMLGTVKAQLSFGAGLSYGTEEIAELGLHGRITYGFTDQWRGSGKFNYFFSDDPFSWFDLNLDAHYMALKVGGAIDIYPLAGLNIAIIGCDICGPFFKDSSETEVGLNLGGGIEFGFTERLKGVGELKFVIGDADQLVFTFGVIFNLGK